MQAVIFSIFELYRVVLFKLLWIAVDDFTPIFDAHIFVNAQPVFAFGDCVTA